MLKLMPMNIYDVAAQQARMEDQAARGWFAVSVPGIFFLAVFEKGEPKAVRYRLEPAPVKESCPDPERLAAYQSMGWEYVDTSGKSMHLWRCDDPDAPELHTDPETEAQAYDRLFRRQQKVTQFWAAVTALLAVLAVQTLLTERTLLVCLLPIRNAVNTRVFRPNKIKQSYHITQKAARSRQRAAFLRGKLGRRQKFSKK